MDEHEPPLLVEPARLAGEPERDLVFLAVADEETGGHLGTQWLLANRPDVFEGVRFALNEGGITEMQGERVTYYGIEIATSYGLTTSLFFSRRCLI